jgi:hypothetical protein
VQISMRITRRHTAMQRGARGGNGSVRKELAAGMSN